MSGETVPPEVHDDDWRQKMLVERAAQGISVSPAGIQQEIGHRTEAMVVGSTSSSERKMESPVVSELKKLLQRCSDLSSAVLHSPANITNEYKQATDVAKLAIMDPLLWGQISDGVQSSMMTAFSLATALERLEGTDKEFSDPRRTLHTALQSVQSAIAANVTALSQIDTTR